jgi:uncharacterized membrane protein
MPSRLRAWAGEHRCALALIALGSLLRLILLNARSLWFDETATLYIAQSRLSLIIPRVGALEENPPLHYLLMHFWTFLFSDPVFGLRLFSALCGMASLAVFAALCGRLIPKQETTALFLASVSSFWIHFSQDGRLYGLFLLLALSSTLAFLRLVERWSAKTAAAYAALCIAGLYTHNFFVFALAGHAAHLILERGGLPRRWFGLYALIVTAYAPWLARLLSQIHLLARASVLQEPLTWHNLAYVAGTMVFDTSFLSLAHEGLTVTMGACLLALLAAGVLIARRRLGAGAGFCLLQITVGLLGLRAMEFALQRAATQARYLIFISPFLYMALSAVIDRASSGRGRFLRLPCVLVVIAGTALYFAGAVNVDPHLAGVAKKLRRTTDSRDPIVYLDPYFYLPMRYYYLTERAQHMVGPDAKIANWDGLPGYRAYLSRQELEELPRCVVIDPRQVMFAQRVGLASGAQVAKAAY